MGTLHPEMLRSGMEPGTMMESDGIRVVENNSGPSYGDFQIQYETPSMMHNRPSAFEMKMRKGLLFVYTVIVST